MAARRSPGQAGTVGTIVVGFDGSPSAEVALDWALAEAVVRRARVLVLAVSPLPWSLGYDPNWHADREQIAGERRAEVEAAVAASRTRVGVPDDVEVEARVQLDERPAFVLITAAADADLLVVGSRGRGGFRGLLLGSVSTACVHHAPCPVVVVPSPSGDG
ncbi:MAG: universal stress protein [Actinobacteria bacterium]|nr:universal stress protein [Actinomycetota bacterium]